MEVKDRPKPMTCRVCGKVRDEWEWDEEEQCWDWGWDWFWDPALAKFEGYLDSVHCYRRALRELEG